MGQKLHEDFSLSRGVGMFDHLPFRFGVSLLQRHLDVWLNIKKLMLSVSGDSSCAASFTKEEGTGLPIVTRVLAQVGDVSWKGEARGRNDEEALEEALLHAAAEPAPPLLLESTVETKSVETSSR